MPILLKSQSGLMICCLSALACTCDVITSGHQVDPHPPILTLLFPVRFMLLPSAFSQVIGVLASSSPQVTL